MNLQQRVKGLTQGVNDNRHFNPSQPTIEGVGQMGERAEQSQELMLKIVSEHVTTLTEAIKEIYRGVCSFSAITDKVENERRELYKLAEEVKNQKLDVGKLIYILEKHINSFPSMVAKSIESAIGVTSHHLDKSLDGLVMEIQQNVLQTFKQQIEMINQAATKTAKSADSLIDAKKFFGWQSLCINLLGVSIAAITLILVIAPRIPEFRVNEEDQRHITNGKNFEAVWPKLSRQAQHEIKNAYSKR